MMPLPGLPPAVVVTPVVVVTPELAVVVEAAFSGIVNLLYDDSTYVFDPD